MHISLSIRSDFPILKCHDDYRISRRENSHRCAKFLSIYLSILNDEVLEFSLRIRHLVPLLLQVAIFFWSLPAFYNSSFVTRCFDIQLSINTNILRIFIGAAVAEWLSSWLAEQEDRGLIPGLATWIFRDWLSPASKSRYGWKIAKSTSILKTTNQPTNEFL